MDANLMGKLGIDPRVVDQAHLAMDKAAQGKGWKLQGWEGEGGIWELRGLIEGDEGEDDEKVEWDMVVEGEEETGTNEEIGSSHDASTDKDTGDEEEAGSYEEMLKDEL